MLKPEEYELSSKNYNVDDYFLPRKKSSDTKGKEEPGLEEDMPLISQRDDVMYDWPEMKKSYKYLNDKESQIVLDEETEKNFQNNWSNLFKRRGEKRGENAKKANDLWFGKKSK